MAALSESAVRTIWQKAIWIYEQQRRAAATTSSTNFITLQAALIAALSGDYVNDMTARIQGTRQKLTTILNDASSATEVVFRYYAQAIDTPETDVQSAITRVYNWFVTNSYTIPSRLFVWASPAAAGGNTGNGTIQRLNTDSDSNPIENQIADAKTAKCVADATSGTEKNEENFEFRGGAAATDNLTFAGSGKKTNIASLSARASQRFIRNASFSQGTPAGATAVPTDITSWTSSITVSGTNYEIIGGTGVNGFYRDFPGDTTPLALRLKATGTTTLSQNLETLRSSFSTAVPYYCHVAWRRKGTADGTLTLTLGASSTAVDITTGTADIWNILKIGLGAANWFKVFGNAGLSLSISRTSATTGNVDIDDVVVAPMANFDGSWYSVIGGSTQFLLDDSFTFTDTEQGSAQAVPQGVLQSWLFRTSGRYLPAKTMAPLTACVAALAGAGAGNVENGNHSWKYTYVHSGGGESAPAATSNVLNVVDKTTNGQVSLTGITVGPTGTTARKVYRTVTGDAGNYKLVGTISDNVTTVMTDNVADASLGANAPAALTVADPV